MASQQDTPKFEVGQHISIRGTGRWWTGLYRAAVVDIREEDNTVKVQYISDGGFKRFKYDELAALYAHAADVTEDPKEGFGTQDYEWSDDQYNPLVVVETEVTRLRAQLREAVRARDFMKADALKREILEREKAVHQLQQEEHNLRRALNVEDYKKAAQIQTRLDQLAKEHELELSPGAVVGGVTSAANSPASGKGAVPRTEPSSGSSSRSSAAAEPLTFGQILHNSAKRALGSGVAGATAMVLQVTTLMWMRTTMNYQYKNGTTTRQALNALYNDGGIRRFYRGYVPALLQGPLSRFGDTAANVGMLTFLNSNESTKNLPVAIKTFCASGAAAAWRVFLMPIDTVKTSLQVNGADGWKMLMQKQRAGGPLVFYHGAMGASFATFSGHLPWFYVFNQLQASVPEPDTLGLKLSRNAAIGFCASAVSDTVSNSLRVVKTVRQTNSTNISYLDAAKDVVAKDGLAGLFGRGLQTRLIANGMQGMMFSVAWKFVDEALQKRM